MEGIGLRSKHDSFTVATMKKLTARDKPEIQCSFSVSNLGTRHFILQFYSRGLIINSVH